MTYVPAMLKSDYESSSLRADWILECVACIKDATTHLLEVELLANEGLASKPKGIMLGGEDNVFQKNIVGISSSLKDALLNIAIFSDQFGTSQNKRNPQASGLLFKLDWSDLDRSKIEQDALIRLSKYMRNYFSHVRTGKHSPIIASVELDDSKPSISEWTSQPYYKIDIQKMVKNSDIRVPRGIGISDFTDLLTDKQYTNLYGKPTGEAYIDVVKFCKAMVVRLHQTWREFVEDNAGEIEKVKNTLSHPVLQGKLREVNYALDASNLSKLGWHNIVGDYIPSKYETQEEHETKIQNPRLPNHSGQRRRRPIHRAR